MEKRALIAAIFFLLPCLMFGRVTDGLQVLYTFTEGTGDTVNDVSGVGTPLNLTVQDPGYISWDADQGLVIVSSTIVRSPGAATKLINACQATDEITFEAWILTSDITKTGPARILTLSKGSGDRAFTLGMNHPDYDDEPIEDYFYICRLNAGEPNGTPELIATDTRYSAPQLQHVVYTRRSSDGGEFLYVNGVEIASDTKTGNFSGWDTDYIFALGDELDDDPDNRDWVGTFYLVAVYDKALTFSEVEENYNDGYVTGYTGQVW